MHDNNHTLILFIYSMMKHFLIILSFVILAPFSSAYAQSDQPLRVEFSSLGRNDDFTVMLAGEQGLIVLRDDGKGADDQRIWRLFGYSGDMTSKWKATITLGKDLELADRHYRDGKANLLFIDSRNKESTLELVKVDMSTGEVVSRSFALPDKLNVWDFKVLDGQAFVLGINSRGLKNFLSNVFSSSDDRERRIRLVRYDWKSDEATDISENIDAGMRPLRLDIYGNEKTIDVYTALAVSESSDELWMYSFSAEGEMTNRYRFSPVEGKSIVELVVTSSGENRYIAVSMSGIRERYERYEDYTDGLYLSVFNQGEEAVSRFYKLSNLGAFYKKADPDMFRFFPGRKEMAGSVGYQLNMHPEIKGGENEMILLAEAYYPEYHTEWYYDAYGMAHSRYVFDGYRYTHALAIAFNKKAEVVWDEAMEINGIRSYSPALRLDAISDNGTTGIVYNLDNELHYKLISEGTSDGDQQAVTLPLMHPDDKLKGSEEGRIRYWYGSYLLASGYQKIENKSKGNRKIFYIYKIAFQ